MSCLKCYLIFNVLFQSLEPQYFSFAAGSKMLCYVVAICVAASVSAGGEVSAGVVDDAPVVEKAAASEAEGTDGV